MLRRVSTSQHPGVVYVLNLNKIADPEGHFQPVIDGVPVRFTDGIHWTFAGDAWLAPRILPQIALRGRGNHGGSGWTSPTSERRAASILPTRPRT